VLEIPGRLVSDETEKALRNITSLGAALFAAAYGIGFVVVTMHHAAYGFFEFSILRPRIFAAGLGFLVLTGLPIWLSRRGTGNRPRERATTIVPEPGPKQFSVWLLECFSEAVFFGVLLVQGFRPIYVASKPAQDVGWHVAIPLIVSFMAFSVAFIFGRRRPVIAFTVVTSTLAAIFCIFGYVSGNELRDLGVWFTGVTFLSLTGIPIPARDRNDLQAVHDLQTLSTMPLWIVLVMTFYSVRIYGSLAPQFGGAVPVPVIVQFAKKDFIDKPTTLPTMLVEETEFGYYVTASRDAHSAYFIPRDSVSSIQYDHSRIGSPQP
jgi:hypothetical protein